MLRQKMVMGNWKMNGNLEHITLLLKAIQADLPPALNDITCVVFPPSIYIPHVASILGKSQLYYGAQNVYPKDAGAFTGEISAPMLSDYHCQYVLVGHSERRNLFHEDEKFVAEKFHYVKEHGMIPVLCVGETLNEREQGLTESTLTKQLTAIIDLYQRNDVFRNVVIAYEPVWAIGSGLTPEPSQVEAVHQFIRSWVSEFNPEDAEKMAILYGGSVNEKNARQLFAMPNVDGGLIGGASLNARQFTEIVRCII